MSPRLLKSLKLDNPPAPEDKRNWPPVILSIMAFTILLLGLVQIYLANTMAVRGEEIQSYEERLQLARQQIILLEKKVNERGSLTQIEKQAEEKLKMVKVNQDQIIYLVPDSFASLQ